MKYDFVQKKSGKFTYYISEQMEENGALKHCFTTRAGGVSTGNYAAMNLGFSTGDSRENIRKNFEIVCDEMGFSENELVLSKQLHGDNVVLVDEKDKGAGILKESSFEEADALLCATPGVVLCLFFADCVPVLLYDEKKKVLALVHAGWRGTVKKIAAKAVREMVRLFSSDPADIRAAIGPSVHPCCYEVGREVASEFLCAFPNKEDIVQEIKDGKFVCDLQRANVSALCFEGVKEESVSLSGLCTSCRHDEFFSHRASGGKRGSLAVFATIK